MQLSSCYCSLALKPTSHSNYFLQLPDSYFCTPVLDLHRCKKVSFKNNNTDTVYDTCSRIQEKLFIASPTCVFLFFRQQPIDVLFLHCQFALSLPFWLPSNGLRDPIAQRCAFTHPDSDSQLANEFCFFYSLEAQSKHFLYFLSKAPCSKKKVINSTEINWYAVA